MPQIPDTQISMVRTHHFEERSAQRRLHPAVLQFILAFGSAVRSCGATHLTVLERALPSHLRGTLLAERARGWIVLETDEGSLLTCYRRQDAARFLRRKRKRRLSRTQLGNAWGRLPHGQPRVVEYAVHSHGGSHAR